MAQGKRQIITGLPAQGGTDEGVFGIAVVDPAIALGMVALATLAMGAKPTDAAMAFGDGFWSLIPITMQMAFVVIGGYVVASSPPAVKHQGKAPIEQ